VKSYFPKAEVSAYYPKNPENEKDAIRIFDTKPDWIIGYSLGSLWLLSHKGMIPPQTKIILMAPILAFPAEKKLGGKTPLGKLNYQKKMLRSSEDYLSSLKGFFDLSGIRLPENDLQQPYSRETLIRGLDFLETTSVSPDATQDCIAITGLRDPLLDANQLKQLIPHLILIEKCDHSPHKMLTHLASHNSMPDDPSLKPSQSHLSQRIS
jgi:hypothetical protein